MSKAILVIDMPRYCNECPICASYQTGAFSPREYWCVASENIGVDPDKKPDWCPLRPLPEKKIIWHIDERSNKERGYNDCLCDIIGWKQYKEL